MLAQVAKDFDNTAEIWTDETKQQFIESRKKLATKEIEKNKFVMPVSGNYRVNITLVWFGDHLDFGLVICHDVNLYVTVSGPLNFR